MGRKDFMQYIWDNFNVAGEFTRMLENAIDYAEGFDDPEDGLDFLCDLLDGTIGISRDEIRRFEVGED